MLIKKLYLNFMIQIRLQIRFDEFSRSVHIHEHVYSIRIVLWQLVHVDPCENKFWFCNFKGLLELKKIDYSVFDTSTYPEGLTTQIFFL